MWPSYLRGPRTTATSLRCLNAETLKARDQAPKILPELCSAPWLEQIVEHIVSKYEGAETHRVNNLVRMRIRLTDTRISFIPPTEGGE